MLFMFSLQLLRLRYSVTTRRYLGERHERGQRGESESQQIIREAYHGDSREYLSTFLQQNKQMFSILKYFNLKEFKKGFYLLGL